ncbi:MAG: FkbM family methyltransferase [Bacteroidales bacterium]|nr:FkbM family methyltransferase [Bacteroidales bacterium]
MLKNRPLYKYHYFLQSVIKDNDVVVDIGANLGYYSIPFSKWVGPKGMVYAVEPVVPVRDVLIRNIGNIKNIKVIPYALGTENKNIRLGNNTRQNKGFIATGSHFVLEDQTDALDEFSAEMRKGSELFGSLERLDFIKCDVEGYETSIIPELKEVLLKHKPVMLIETRREKRTFLVDYLLNIGFHGFVLEGGKLYPAAEIKEKMEDDILFIHRDKLELFSDRIGTHYAEGKV